MKLKSIDELYDFEETDLDDLHDRLWYEYFTPAKKHDKETANFIRVQLNAVGAAIKIEAEKKKNPLRSPIMVEPSTKFEPDEMGPNWLKPIYCETAPPIAILPAAKVRGKKLPVPPNMEKPMKLVIDSEDDLMGDEPKKKVKPAASAKPAAPGKSKSANANGKTNYEWISELAAKGKDKDQIITITGLPRKTVGDNIWRYNKSIGK